VAEEVDKEGSASRERVVKNLSDKEKSLVKILNDKYNQI
jgi:hypothetical protein